MHKRRSRSGLPNSIIAYHPICVAFQSALKQRRKNANQMVRLSHSFSTPFAVRENIFGQYNMILAPHNIFVVYDDLKFDSADYAEMHDMLNFEKFE